MAATTLVDPGGERMTRHGLPARISLAALTSFTVTALRRVGVREEDAALLADLLVDTDRMGIHSHGVRMLPQYARGLRDGAINPTPCIRPIERDGGATGLIDGDNGPGHLIAHHAMRLAVEGAKEHGIAAIVARRSNHFGAAGLYAREAARHSMIGIATSSAPALMAPWGATSPTLGNNPLAIAAPTRDPDAPLILDMASSMAARSKIRLHADERTPIPGTWAFDRDGAPTTDPDIALGGLLRPAGDYKGFGLALMSEVLCAALSGSRLATEISRTILAGQTHDTLDIGCFLLAIDIRRFLPVAAYLDAIDRLIGAVQQATPIDPGLPPLLPGELEQRQARRQGEAIELPSTVVARLQILAGELDLNLPVELRAAPT